MFLFKRRKERGKKKKGEMEYLNENSPFFFPFTKEEFEKF